MPCSITSKWWHFHHGLCHLRSSRVCPAIREALTGVWSQVRQKEKSKREHQHQKAGGWLCCVARRKTLFAVGVSWSSSSRRRSRCYRCNCWCRSLISTLASQNALQSFKLREQRFVFCFEQTDTLLKRHVLIRAQFHTIFEAVHVDTFPFPRILGWNLVANFAADALKFSLFMFGKWIMAWQFNTFFSQETTFFI